MRLLIDNFEDAISEIATEAVDIRVVIAFLTKGGLEWLPEDRIQYSQFIVGINLGVTTPEVLRYLQEFGADVRIFYEKGKLFHPKAIFLKTTDEEHLVIGSNNLTSAGIGGNREIAMMCKRTHESDGLFLDFLAHYEWLKNHGNCSEPTESFYHQYRPSSFRRHLQSALESETEMSLQSSRPALAIQIDDDEGTTLRSFLYTLAKNFPNLERRRGVPISDHPLKRLNDDIFRPRFREIVADATDGRLQGASDVNIGGNWYRIPLIVAVTDANEPYENTKANGRLCLQIHFSDSDSIVFATAHCSVVLQYYTTIDGTRDGTMPEPVRRRYETLMRHLGDYSSRTDVDGPAFLHWEYKGTYLWSKPIISFTYPVDALPSEDTLVADLRLLSVALNGVLTVR